MGEPNDTRTISSVLSLGNAPPNRNAGMRVSRWPTTPWPEPTLAAVLVLAGCMSHGTSGPEGPSGPMTFASPVHSALARRCQQNDTGACGELGALLLERSADEPDRDFERGVVLLEMACGNDDGRACGVLGKLYGRNTKASSRARGRDLLTAACQSQIAGGCTVLGELSLAIDEAQDTRAGEAALREGCRLGDARGCELLGEVELRDKMMGQKDVAANMFAMACGMGRLQSCHRLAILRRDSQRHAEGLNLMAENCRQGYGPSCLALAAAAAPLISASPDCKTSLPFADLGCKSGAADGCAIADACRLAEPAGRRFALARLLSGCQARAPLPCLYWADALSSPLSGDPAVDDLALIEAYRTTCGSKSPGAPLACGRVAVKQLEEAKTSLEADPALAALRESCIQSSGEACCALGAQYQSGRWTPPDPRRTTELRARACELGQRDCCPGK